jgi:transposase-like protein
MNMLKLMALFHSDDRCRAYLEGLRWPDGVKCPRCESAKISRSYKRNQFVCDSCDYNFSVTSGTIFHDTKLPLVKWFVATYLMTESKKGMSANQIKRTLDVSYKTAWYLCHRIRHAMNEASGEPLSGTLEVDETFVGGKVKGQGRGFRGNKATVVGVVQRKGEIRLQVAGGTDRETLHAIIHKHALPTTEAIYTDEWPAYKGIGDADTVHESVNHKAEEWVRGDVHTQTVESVWSLLKRSIVGSYHHVSVKHLDAYLNELEWRFNERQNPFMFRDTLRRLLQANNLEYSQLTGAD